MTTTHHMTVAANPDFTGPAPNPDAARCHDGSGFIDVRCPCSNTMHVHRTQFEHAPVSEIGTRCKECGDYLVFQKNELLVAIDSMWNPAPQKEN